jgi:hypothetical protein
MLEKKIHFINYVLARLVFWYKRIHISPIMMTSMLIQVSLTVSACAANAVDVSTIGSDESDSESVEETRRLVFLIKIRFGSLPPLCRFALPGML